MTSIFDPSVQPDHYTEHMKRTMEWIEDKIREAREGPHADPCRPHTGYNVEIVVEARWLQQLVAELIGKHQIIMSYQRQCAEIASAYRLQEMARPIVFPADAVAKTKKEG